LKLSQTSNAPSILISGDALLPEASLHRHCKGAASREWVKHLATVLAAPTASGDAGNPDQDADSWSGVLGAFFPPGWGGISNGHDLHEPAAGWRIPIQCGLNLSWELMFAEALTAMESLASRRTAVATMSQLEKDVAAEDAILSPMWVDDAVGRQVAEAVRETRREASETMRKALAL
jgi:hypothetical protein